MTLVGVGGLGAEFEVAVEEGLEGEGWFSWFEGSIA